MEDLVTVVLINGIVIPIIIVVSFAVICKSLIRRSRADSLVGASIGISVLVGYLSLFGWPDIPPRGSAQKIPFIIIFGGVIGLWIDLKGAPYILKNGLKFVWPTLIVGWLGWRQFINFSADYSLYLFVLLLASIFILDCIDKHKRRSSFPAILFMLASLGASFITLVGSSGALSQQFIILAAACGGFLVCNWPRERFKFNNSAILVTGGAFISLSTSTVLFSEAYLPAFALLVIVFITPIVTLRMPYNENPTLGPIMLGILGIIPVSIATILAIFITGGDFVLPV